MNTIEKFLTTIWAKGEVREIRIEAPDGKITYGYFDSIKAASAALMPYNQKAFVFITLNPTKQGTLARSYNKLRFAGKKNPTTSDNDIESLKYLLIDCDPKRPSGISSTDEEKQAAYELAQTLRIDLGEPVIMGDSGNGYHLIYKHNAMTAEPLRAFLFDLAKNYDNDKVSIDTKVFNPSRITKVLGTWAIKGENIPSRPHRESKILEIGKSPVILDIPLLSHVPQTANVTIGASKQFDIDQFLAKNNILVKKEKEWNGCRMLTLEECAFDSTHKQGEASILVHKDGKLSYQCFHNSCQGKTWADFRSAIGDVKTSSTSQCRTCGETITWTKENGKYIPISDGVRHFCNKKRDTVSLSDEPALSTIYAEKQIADEENITTVDFPIWVYPPTMQMWLKEISSSVSSPIDFAACSLLAVSGALLAKKTIGIKSGWRERPNIYLALCGDTGQGKSPSLSAVTSPVVLFEQELKEQYDKEKKNYEISMDIYNSMPKSKRNPETKPEKPPQKTLMSTNATVESISKILLNNPSLLLIKDELTGWIKSMNQYRGGKGDDTEFYLSCWSGSAAKVDRVKEDSLFIPHACLSIVGGIVPENVHILVPETKDGFVERILFCFPNRIEKKWSSTPIHSAPSTDILRKLYMNREQEQFIQLDEPSLKIFQDFYEKTHIEIANTKDDTHLKGFLEKSIAYVARFALILNCLWENGDFVSPDVLNAAIALINYFKAHNQKAHKELSSSKENKEVNAIYEWAKRKDLKSANIRLLVRAGLSGCKNAETTKNKLHELVSMDMARWIIYEKEISFIF